MESKEGQTTIVAPTAQFNGELRYDGAAQVLGSFEGRIVATGEVHVGEGAVCKATIEADTVLVDGEVEGDITARQRLKLTSTARVVGDLISRTLTVEEGASFVGHCKVSAESQKDAQVSGDRLVERNTPTEEEEAPVRSNPSRVRSARDNGSPAREVQYASSDE